MDIGVCMSRSTLDEKLALRHDTKPEAAWNLRTWPRGFKRGEINRLYVAVERTWRGYFTFKDALFNPRDRAVPYALLFDTSSWTPISPAPAPRFRGFTYDVPPSTRPSHPDTGTTRRQTT